ncbi:transposase [Arthrobacter sp. PO-11]|uniref:Transposase n=1 Tax=Arthrobacter cavernae TaxID=2817681 RepID=A0A939HI41_9MICC|nr:transposase [Arthrobacter cavernae]
MVTGATTAKVEANNTAIKHIKRTARGYRNPDNYKSRIILRRPPGRQHERSSQQSIPGNLEEQL